MRKIKLDHLWGQNIETVLAELKNYSSLHNEDCFCKFNDSFLYSTDTIDSAYLRIVGKTKLSFDYFVKTERKKFLNNVTKNIKNLDYDE